MAHIRTQILFSNIRSPALFDSISDGGLDQGVLPIAWLFSTDLPDGFSSDDILMRRFIQKDLNTTAPASGYESRI